MLDSNIIYLNAIEQLIYNFQQSLIQMSDHKEVSEDSSLDQNYQIRVNQDGQNQLYVPCWEEEASSNTQYYHLLQENKFFKNKCMHLQNHLEQNHRQFSSLNQLYMMAESNERRLLKENQELKRRNNDLVKQLKESSSACQEATFEVQSISKRQSQLREKLSKSKEREKQSVHKIESLEKQMELLRQKLISNQSRAADCKEEQNTSKEHYRDEFDRIEAKLKTAYNQLQTQFNTSQQQLKQKTKQVRSLQKTIQTTNLQHRQQIQKCQERMKNLEDSSRQRIYKLQNEVTVLTRINGELKDQNLKPILNLKAEKQKTNNIRQLEQLRLKLTQVERELQLERSMTRGREHGRSTERQKLQQLEATLGLKDQQIQQLEEKVHNLQEEYEQEKMKLKRNDREQRTKENQLSKKQKKIKELLEQILILEARNRELEDETQVLREETERIKIQLQLQLSQNQKLKGKIGNKKQQEPSKQQFKIMQEQIHIKDDQIEALKKQVEREAQQNSSKANSSEVEVSLRQTIASLEEQIMAKQQTIKELRIHKKNFEIDGSVDQQNYEALQEQYNRELIALKRLIAFKGKQEENLQLKAEYESQAQIILSDYKIIQEQMLALRQKVIMQSSIASEPFRMRAIQQVWKQKIDRLWEEREVLVQTVSRWQKKYEQMCYIFEAKLQSKEEAINLLKLRLSNYQLSRGSACLSPYH